MTASAPSSPRPGRAAPAGRPAAALWVLLLVALLTALPCAGQAKAVGAHAQPAPTTIAATVTATAVSGHAPHTGPATTASDQRQRAEEQRHWTWCTADGEPPRRDNGCSSHPYCPQDAQLPNPPPHPQSAASPLTPAVETLPRVVPAGLLDAPHPAPDLHELQVHRS
ncbi:hypothetical protein ACIOJE_20165 [Kitasatospora sp. NPDC087861]|uniref:hypothetical protein n=1 Tax=Kitasatospora sp. NPDC087861 TaxID=3364070 RepID=UPI00380D7EAF